MSSGGVYISTSKRGSPIQVSPAAKSAKLPSGELKRGEIY
jgi:hypothetical protein